MKKTQHNHEIYYGDMSSMSREPFTISYGHSPEETSATEYVTKEDYDSVSDMAAGNVCNYCFNEMDKNADIQTVRKSELTAAQAEIEVLKAKLEECKTQRDAEITDRYPYTGKASIYAYDSELSSITIDSIKRGE